MGAGGEWYCHTGGKSPSGGKMDIRMKKIIIY